MEIGELKYESPLAFELPSALYFSAMKFDDDSITWQDELARSVRDPDELRRLLGLPAAAGQGGGDEFPLLVPRPYLRRMEPGKADDPLLRQVLPRDEETLETEGFSRDPLAECAGVGCLPAVLTKYAGRSLLIASDLCGVHCRFCFRRHSFGKCGSGQPTEEHLSRMLRPIQSDPSVSEVILSGGDPLCLDDTTLDRLLYYIEKIPHVKRIRIHSRLPVVIPNRWTPDLLAMLRRRLPIFVVLHVNHPRELDETRFFELSMPQNLRLLSQSVLLAGVNDDEETLYRLLESLVDRGILPYYLHQLDRVAGAAHFEVPVERGLQLLESLRRRLPGYAVPRYVREEPNFPYKRHL